MYRGDPLKDSELSPVRRCCAIPKSMIVTKHTDIMHRIIITRIFVIAIHKGKNATNLQPSKINAVILA